MADRQSTRVRESLKGLFSDQRLNAMAKSSQFVERDRKLKAVPFFWTLVLGFGVGSTRTIAGLRRAYQRSTGVEFAPSAFYDRFTLRLVSFLKAAVEHALKEFRLALGDLGDRFNAFADVMITDSTVIKLHDGLASVFPGCRSNCAPASAKLHAVLSVKGRGKSTVRLTNGRVHDRRKLVVGEWVRGKLLLFDLGYYHFRLFRSIARLGGHFVTRLKENANPTIVRVLNGSAGDAKLIGKALQDVLVSLRRDVLDVEVEVRARARSYGGKQSSTTERFRLVAIRNAEKRKYHCYLTTLPTDMLSASEVASCYRARWEIELIFRELKSGYRLDDVESEKKEVVESLIYAAVLTLLASRTLLRTVASRLGGELRERITAGRWWKVFSEYAQELQLLVIRPPREAPNVKALITTIAHELVDPHTTRRPLLATTLGTSQASSEQQLTTP